MQPRHRIDQKRVKITLIDGEMIVGYVREVQKSGLFKVQWLELDTEEGITSVNLDNVMYITEIALN